MQYKKGDYVMWSGRKYKVVSSCYKNGDAEELKLRELNTKWQGVWFGVPADRVEKCDK